MAKVIEVNTGTNETTSGQKCIDDFDCVTGESCVDAPGWFTGKICKKSSVVTPGSDQNAKQSGISKSEINTATTATLLKSMCVQQEHCDNLSKCTSLQSLVDDGVISDIKARQIADTISGQIKTATGIGGALTVGGLCAAAVGWTGVGLPICAGAGVATYFGVDSFFGALSDGKLETTGLCIKSGGGVCDFLSPIGFISITGDKCTDGGIILGIIILIFFMFFMGGRR